MVGVIKKVFSETDEFMVQPFSSSLIFSDIFVMFLALENDINQLTMKVEPDRIPQVIEILESVLARILRVYYREPSVKQYIKNRSRYIVYHCAGVKYKIDYRTTYIGHGIYFLTWLIEYGKEKQLMGESIWFELG